MNLAHRLPQQRRLTPSMQAGTRQSQAEMRFGPYGIPIHAVPAANTGRFAMPNRPFRNPLTAKHINSGPHTAAQVAPSRPRNSGRGHTNKQSDINHLYYAGKTFCINNICPSGRSALCFGTGQHTVHTRCVGGSGAVDRPPGQPRQLGRRGCSAVYALRRIISNATIPQ